MDLSIKQAKNKTPTASKLEIVMEFFQNFTITIPLTLNFLGCLFNVTFALYLDDKTNSIRKIVLVLSVVDFISSTTALYSLWKLNIIMYYIWLVSRNQSIAWVCCFTHSLWSSYKRTVKLGAYEFFWRYLLISILVACIWTFSFGKIQALQILPPMVAYAVPSVIGVVFCSFYCGLLYIKLPSDYSNTILELLRFPLILIFCNGYFLVFFFSERSGNNPWWITIWEICFNLQGLFNAFASALGVDLWHTIKEKLRRRRHSQEEDLEFMRTSTSELATYYPSFVIN